MDNNILLLRKILKEITIIRKEIVSVSSEPFGIRMLPDENENQKSPPKKQLPSRMR